MMKMHTLPINIAKPVRVLGLLSLLTGALLLGTACAAPAATPPAAPAEPPAPLSVAVLKGPTALGLLPLIETPELADGTALDVEILPAPDVLVGRLATGELDFAAVPTNLAVKLFNKGQDYRLIAMNTWGAMHIIGTDGNLTSLSDLKGKTLHSTGKGTTPDIILNFLLKQQGIDPVADLTVDATLAPVELAQLAAAGKVDLALLPEPFVTLVLGKNTEMKLLMDVSTLYREALAKPDIDIAQTCLVVRGDLLTERPDAVEAFMTAYEASLKMVNASPAEAGVLAEKHQLIQSAALAEQAIPRSGIRFESAADAKLAIQTYLNVLLENAPADIGGKLPDEDFYVLEY